MKKILLIALFLVVLPFHVAFSEEGFMTHQEITISFAYGDRIGYYTGSTVDGKPSGYGLFETRNTSGNKWMYIGEFKDGTFNGQGAQYWEFHSTHIVGTFENGDIKTGQSYSANTTGMNEGAFEPGSNVDSFTGKVYNYKNQLVFEGTVKDGVFQSGTLYNNQDGSVVATGEFGEGFKNFIENHYISGYVYY